ncbi:hypothetical protein ACJKIH_21245 [Brucella pseudogrignonensis]|uniref:hypothetical protein n=1 Tax=Brucella pseudogrignonensis TaxID=419475 RepID=UPI000AA046DD
MTDWRTRTSSAEQIIGDTGALTPVRRARSQGSMRRALPERLPAETRAWRVPSRPTH